MARLYVSANTSQSVGRYRFDKAAVFAHFGAQSDPQRLNELCAQFGLPRVCLKTIERHGINGSIATLIELGFRMDRPLDLRHVLIQDR